MRVWIEPTPSRRPADDAAASDTSFGFARCMRTRCERQLRWIIEERAKPVGAVDLYDFSSLHQRSGIGILVDPGHRGKGTAGRALDIAVKHARDVLLLHSLHAEVHAEHDASVHLFQAGGFSKVGHYADWTRTRQGWMDVALFQLTFNEQGA